MPWKPKLSLWKNKFRNVNKYDIVAVSHYNEVLIVTLHRNTILPIML